LTADFVLASALSLNVLDTCETLLLSSLILDFALLLNRQSDILSHQVIVCFTFAHSLIDKSFFLLFISLLQELRDQGIFTSLLIKLSLGILLVNNHLSAATIALFPSKIRVFLSFLDFVHGGGIREILDLTWRNTTFLFLLLNSFFH